MGRPRLLFIAARFLLPPDSGNKIRSVEVLRGLKGGGFEIILAGPCPGGGERHPDLPTICDRFVGWPAPHQGRIGKALRLRLLGASRPLSAETKDSRAARETMAALLREAPDLVVVDFPQSAVVLGGTRPRRCVVFTHNVELEILERHVANARNPFARAIWADQARKMERFERAVLAGADRVIAVSERDARIFAERFGLGSVATIPTGVDLRRNPFSRAPSEPDRPPRMVFTASFDWMPNVDGVDWLMNEVWPLVARQRPDAELMLVGRDPPPSLVATVAERRLPWRITGYVPEVQPYIQDAVASLIPLRIGGGTRMKAFEAMALGSPVISTAIGIEGLDVVPGEHYLLADRAEDFAAAMLELIGSPARRAELAHAARLLVESRFSADRVARRFEEICLETLAMPAASAPGRAASAAPDRRAVAGYGATS